MDITLRSLAHYATEFYNNSNKYHNWEHALNVVTTVEKMGGSETTILAAYWHDAIYIPGAGEDANERCSAAAMMNTAIRLGIRGTIFWQTVVVAAGMIRGTTVRHHLTRNALTEWDYDQATLMDADLASLASPYERFKEIQDSIILENNGDVNSDRHKSVAFLQQFLTVRPQIYHTPYGREHFEQQARDNITRFAADFSG
jgi:predicted metal-dependent HD superfamily phosphohydrolase